LTFKIPAHLSPLTVAWVNYYFSHILILGFFLGGKFYQKGVLNSLVEENHPVISTGRKNILKLIKNVHNCKFTFNASFMGEIANKEKSWPGS